MVTLIFGIRGCGATSDLLPVYGLMMIFALCDDGYHTVTPAGALVCSVLWSWVTKRSPLPGLWGVLNYCLVLPYGRPFRDLRCSVVGARYQTVTLARALGCFELLFCVTIRSPLPGLAMFCC